jgi:hypothetical protein
MGRAAVAAFALTSVLGLEPAHGNQCNDRAKATQLANTAVELYGKGLYDEASELFRRADEACHNPAFVIERARARQQLGKLTEAVALARVVAAENLPPDAPAPFLQAKKDAEAIVKELEPRLGRLTVKFSDGTTSATLDGAAIDRGPGPIAVDPGDHEIVSTRNDGKEARGRFKVSPGETLTLAVDYETGGLTSSGSDGKKSGGSKTKWIGPGIALGLGGASLLAAAVTGGIFIGKANALKDACRNDGDNDEKTCPPEKQSEGNSVTALGNASTALWIIGGVGCAVGITLAIVTTRSSRDATSASVRVTPTGLTFEGSF